MPKDSGNISSSFGQGVVSRASAAGLVAAGLLSVVISLALGFALLRREQPDADGRAEVPSPVLPVITAEDRALCRVECVASAA